jgi:hypothetical protein
VDDVWWINAMKNPIFRNLAITQCYYDLSRALVELLLHGANWCKMGTWALQQAGRSIRKEEAIAAFCLNLRPGDPS